MRFAAAFCSCALALTAARTEAEEARCGAPEPVCAARERVFAVSSFDPVGSAVLLEPGLLVTGRHVVADHEWADLFLPDGRIVRAVVVPTVYPGDLVLLRATGPLGAADELTPIATAAAGDGDAPLHAVAFDVAAGRVMTASPPGPAIRPSAPGRPLARLHHTSRSGPGTGGGALLDDRGRLVGVLASLGEGRAEAIPAADLAELRRLSGAPFKLESDRIGRTYRACVEALDRARATGPDLGDAQAEGLVRDCAATGNRQIFDQTGNLLAMAGRIGDARAMFEASLDQDPNAVNAMLGIALTLHMVLRFEEAVPYLERLVELVPDEAQVLQLAVQAGKWGGDGALAARACDLLEVHHPEQAPRAREFLNAAGGPPPPAGPKPDDVWTSAAWLSDLGTGAPLLPRLSQ